MPMVPFFTRLRDLAFREMRSITLPVKRSGIPAGTYGLLESYCDEPGCDCRTVFLSVISTDPKLQGRTLATINFGWEDLDFYTNWMHGDAEAARDMKGPGLALGAPEDPALAPAFRDLVKDQLRDPAYVQSLVRHYRLFRAEIEARPAPARAPVRPVGRNAPCPCGSGKKHKQCCARKTAETGAATPAPKSADLARLRARLADLRAPGVAGRPPSTFVMALDREFTGLGAGLARLAVSDESERVREDAIVTLFCAVRDPALAGTLQAECAREAAPVLRAAFEDPGLSDERKYRIGPLLAACGVELPRERYVAQFRDFDAMVARETIDSMKNMSSAPGEVVAFLDRWGLITAVDPVEPEPEALRAAFEMGAALAVHNPTASVPALAATAAIAAEWRSAIPEAKSALEQVAGVGTPAAAWHLRELGGWPGTGEIGRHAATLAARLESAGVAAAVHSPATFSHGHVSALDGVGSRSVTLFFRTSAGGMDFLTFLLNDEVGLKDVWCVFEDGASVEERLRQELKLALAPVTLPLACELLEDALAIHEERGTAPPGRLLLFRPPLGSAPLRAHKRRVNLGAYALEVVVRAPDLAAGSEELCRVEDWREFWFAGDAAYEFVRSRRGRGGKRATRGKKAEEELDHFLREAAAPERDTLLHRMAAKLETEAWAGRARQPLNRLAALTWLALSEELTPFPEVPFVRALARFALDQVTKNVELGFRSQREVNASRLAK